MILFADVGLYLEDPEYRLRDWHERNLPLEDLRLFGSTLAVHDGRLAIPRTPASGAAAINTLNWPAPPKLRINSLYWPTGASRFAMGLFLCTHARLQTIYQNLDANGVARLKMTDGIPRKKKSAADMSGIDVRMYLLPPRPLTKLPEGVNDDRQPLWLLPLVDQRYFWQWAPMPDYSASDIASWEDLFEQIGESLPLFDEQLTAPVPVAAYGKPDVVEMVRRYENAAVLLDAACASIGTRYVRNIKTGGGAILTASQSDDRHDLNMQAVRSDRPYLAGDLPTYVRPYLPFGVRVLFPKYDGGYRMEGRYHAVTTAAGVALENIPEAVRVPGTYKTIFSTARALVEGFSEGESPTNAAELTTLAEQITGDFYKHGLRLHDVSLQGIRRWNPTGHDDFVYFAQYLQPRHLKKGLACGGEFDLPTRTASDWQGDYACYTRVAALPLDCGVSQMQQSFCSGDCCDPPAPGALLLVRFAPGAFDGTIGPQTGTVMRKKADHTLESADKTVEVYDHLRTFDVALGTDAWVEWWAQACQWVVVQMACAEPEESSGE